MTDCSGMQIMFRFVCFVYDKRHNIDIGHPTSTDSVSGNVDCLGWTRRGI